MTLVINIENDLGCKWDRSVAVPAKLKPWDFLRPMSFPWKHPFQQCSINEVSLHEIPVGSEPDSPALGFLKNPQNIQRYSTIPEVIQGHRALAATDLIFGGSPCFILHLIFQIFPCETSCDLRNHVRPGSLDSWQLTDHFWPLWGPFHNGFTKKTPCFSDIYIYTGLVGGWATPLKNMNVNWDDEIPNIWENKKWQPNHQPADLYMPELPKCLGSSGYSQLVPVIAKTGEGYHCIPWFRKSRNESIASSQLI